MKTVLMLALSLSAAPAFAGSIESEIAMELTAKASSILLVGSDERPLPSEYQFFTLLGDGVLGEANLECKNVGPEGPLGAGHFNCEVYIGGVVFTAPASRVVYPGARAKLKTLRFRAGRIQRG